MSQTKLPAFTSGTAAGLDSSYFSGGSVTWERYGDLVVVSINDIDVSKKLVHGVVIATGLPKPREAKYVALAQWSDGTGANTMRVSLGTGGTLTVHYSYNAASEKQYYGQIVYVTGDRSETGAIGSADATQGLFSLGAYGDGYALYQTID